MPDTPVRDFEEARKVFLCAQRWIQRAKQYYTLEEHASDHVEVVREHSQLFKALIFFESDLDRSVVGGRAKGTAERAVLWIFFCGFVGCS